jgi:hypothetical protein
MSETVTYTYNAPMYGQQWGMLVRSDGDFIPVDPNNRDFQGYLSWLDAGNTAPEGAPTRAEFPAT